MSSHVIVTEDSEGRRALRFGGGGARQSLVIPGEPLRLELPYTRMAMVGLAFVPKPARILAVGLGGGAIPMFLHAVLPEVSIDVVDIDPEVVRAAKESCGFREDDRLRVHVADGRAFIESSGPSYGLVILDAYGEVSIPPHLVTREFLGAVRDRLVHGGAVVSNLWESASNPLFPAMVRTHQVSFHHVSRFDVPSTTNRILVGQKHSERYSREALLARALRVERERNLPFKLSALVARRYRPLGKQPRGKVLTDAVMRSGA